MPKRREILQIADVYPEFTAEQQQQAERELLEYLDLIGQIYDDVRRDPERYKQFKALTQELRTRTVKDRSIDY